MKIVEYLLYFYKVRVLTTISVTIYIRYLQLADKNATTGTHVTVVSVPDTSF